MSPHDEQLLSKYFPEKAVQLVYNSLSEKKIHLIFKGSRKTRLGDYRPPYRGKQHRISLNHDLNPYELLYTFVHELAHLYAYEKYGRKHQPHGPEWKQYFEQLIQPYLSDQVFPADVQEAIQQFFEGGATNGSETQLKRVLAGYNADAHPDLVHLETLSDGSFFSFQNRNFQKLHLIRKRIKCKCINDNKLYLFTPLAPVIPAAKPKSKPDSGSQLSLF